MISMLPFVSSLIMRELHLSLSLTACFLQMREEVMFYEKS